MICIVEPAIIIKLPGNFTTFQCYEEAIYLASYSGKSIIKLDSTGSFLSFSITLQANNRIYEFRVTPFHFYLNTPDGIIKMHYTMGVSEIIYSGNITNFIITNTEEIVLADHIKNTLIFLDTDNKMRLQKKNLNVVDMDYYESRIYILTRKDIIALDEYGNILESIRIPENINHISVAEDIYLFSSFSNVVYKKNIEWQKIELKYPVKDLKLNKKYLITLSQYGDYLYFYDRSDF